MSDKSKNLAIITIVGKDKIGTVAEISGFLAQNDINIEEMSQTVMGDIFSMIMRCDLSKSKLTVAELADKIKKLGEKIKHEVHVHDERIFDAMHRI